MTPNYWFIAACLSAGISVISWAFIDGLRYEHKLRVNRSIERDRATQRGKE